MRLRHRLGCRHAGVLFYENLRAAQAPERRPIRWELLGMNDVGFFNFDPTAHVERQVELPVSLLWAGAQ
jgi:hypothetical protein